MARRVNVVLACDSCRQETERIVGKLFYVPRIQGIVRASHANYSHHADVGDCCSERILKLLKFTKRMSRRGGGQRPMQCDLCRKKTEMVVGKLLYSPLVYRHRSTSLHQNYTHHLNVGVCCKTELFRVISFRGRMTQSEYNAIRRRTSTL